MDGVNLQQAAAEIVSRTVAKVLKKELSNKGEEVCHLSSELSRLERDLGLKARDIQSEKDTRKEMEEVYWSNLADLCHKIQALECEAEESTQIRVHLKDALETEIALCRHQHGFRGDSGECTNLNASQVQVLHLT